MIPSECGIVVMDVGSPRLIEYYNEEKETNDLFVRYLNNRLWDLKIKGTKIIECNYLEETHPLVTVNFNLKTLDPLELENFIKDNNIKKLIYTGLHYGRCTHVGRNTGGVYMLKKLKECKVYVAPSLCRPLKTDYWRVPRQWEPELPYINL